MVGIISNTAALSAQSNLKKASTETQASISRLSSGNRIDRAATDVAALAIGTILKTNISTLQAALSNSSQANSLLGVADGALSSIGNILQRQKALASQATAGTLSDTNRGFLNQEFQNLVSEINRIANNTNFNGIALIDGSLYGAPAINTKTSTVGVDGVGLLAFGNATNTTATKTFTINGVVFTAAAVPAATTDFLAGTKNAVAATALYNAIQNLLNSNLSGDAANKLLLSGFDFSLNSNTITITSKNAGTVVNAYTAVTDDAATVITLNGTDLNAGAASIFNQGAGNTASTNGDLFSGTFATGGATAYVGTATTVAQGVVGDSILTAINTVAAASGGGNATGVSTAGISNNAAFVGDIVTGKTGFTATYRSSGYADVQITVGSYTYKALNVQTNPAAATLVRLSSTVDGGGYFDLRINATATSGQAAIATQADADLFAGRLNEALSSVDFYQQRTIANTSYNASGYIYAPGSTTIIGDLTNSTFKLFSDNYTSPTINSIKVEAPSVGSANSKITVVMDGETFVSGYSSTGAAAALGTTIAAGASIGLVGVNDPNKLLVFTNTSPTSTALDISNTANAAAVQSAFETAFGLNSTGSTSLSFQVGIDSTDSISFTLQGATTAKIYLDNSGVAAVLDVSTLTDANTAGTVLTNAINSVTALRASVGALQSRFDYASASIESSIANQDVARGTFLDTDIAAESTIFASSQVRLQASISVLAQANQLPQNLLKLIG